MTNRDYDFHQSRAKKQYPYGASVPRGVGVNPAQQTEKGFGDYTVWVDHRRDVQVWEFTGEAGRDKFVKQFEKAGAVSCPVVILSDDPSNNGPALDPDCDFFMHGQFVWDRG